MISAMRTRCGEKDVYGYEKGKVESEGPVDHLKGKREKDWWRNCCSRQRTKQDAEPIGAGEEELENQRRERRLEEVRSHDEEVRRRDPEGHLARRYCCCRAQEQQGHPDEDGSLEDRQGRRYPEAEGEKGRAVGRQQRQESRFQGSDRRQQYEEIGSLQDSEKAGRRRPDRSDEETFIPPQGGLEAGNSATEAGPSKEDGR